MLAAIVSLGDHSPAHRNFCRRIVVLRLRPVQLVLDPMSNYSAGTRLFEWLKVRLGKRWVQALMLLLLIALASAWSYPRIACSFNGGKWVRDGLLAQAQYCRYVYSDGGRVCYSSQECMGACVITDRPVPGQPAPVVGECKRTNSPFGCYALVERPAQFVCRD